MYKDVNAFNASRFEAIPVGGTPPHFGHLKPDTPNHMGVELRVHAA